MHYVFDTGLKYFPSPSGSLDALVRQQLEFAARDVGILNAPPPVSDSDDLVTEMGEYLTRTAMLWAQLTEQLVHGPHIAQTTIQAHERSKAVSHLSDLAEVAKIDVNIAKLRFVCLLIASAASHRPIPDRFVSHRVEKTKERERGGGEERERWKKETTVKKREERKKEIKRRRRETNKQIKKGTR